VGIVADLHEPSDRVEENISLWRTKQISALWH